MRQGFRITTDDGVALELVAFPPDFVAWERHSKRRMSDLADGMGMEDMLYLAWSALRRNPGSRPPFDVWINTVADVDLLDDEPTPTSPGASATPS